MQNLDYNFTVEDFENKSLKTLKNIAKLYCVKGYSTLCKQALKELLIKELIKTLTVQQMINVLNKFPKNKLFLSVI